MWNDVTARPHFVNAVYQWCIEMKYTPYLLAYCKGSVGLAVPPQLIHDDRLVLNIAPVSVRGLVIDKRGIFFTARFFGQTSEVHVPVLSILAIYARETGKGLSFPPIENDAEDSETPASGDIRLTGKSKRRKKNLPNLQLV